MFRGSCGLLALKIIALGLTLVSSTGNGQLPERKLLPEWAGKGERRILVRVDPLQLEGRTTDESVALLVLDPTTWSKGTVDARLDLNSLHVIKYSPETGKAEPYNSNSYQPPIGMRMVVRTCLLFWAARSTCLRIRASRTIANSNLPGTCNFPNPRVISAP